MAKKFKPEQENATAALYKASYRIVLASEAHSIAELFTKLIRTDVASCVLDEKFVGKQKSVFLFNNKFVRKIDNVASNIETTYFQNT